MKRFITDQCRELTAAVDTIGFIQIGINGKTINSTSLNLLQIVADRHEDKEVLTFDNLAQYETVEQTRQVYNMFLEWLNCDTGNTVFIFPVWDKELNMFDPSWDKQHKKQIVVA